MTNSSPCLVTLVNLVMPAGNTIGALTELFLEEGSMLEHPAKASKPKTPILTNKGFFINTYIPDLGIQIENIKAHLFPYVREN